MSPIVLYMLPGVTIIPVIAFVTSTADRSDRKMHLNQIRMHEACRKNAGVYIGTTIPLETALLEADGSFESTGSSEHIYMSVWSF